jgi:hypothetical protein
MRIGVRRRRHAADDRRRDFRARAVGEDPSARARLQDARVNIADVTRAADETRAVADRGPRVAGRVAAQSGAMRATTTGFLDGIRAA